MFRFCAFPSTMQRICDRSFTFLLLSGSLFPQPVKWGHQYVPPRAAVRKGDGRGSAREGGANCWWLPALARAPPTRPAPPHRLGAQQAGAAVQAPPSPLALPPVRGPGSRAAPPPRSRPGPRPPPEPRPPSDGGAAPGNGALAAQRSSDTTRPGRPRRRSQTTQRAPAAAAARAAPGPAPRTPLHGRGGRCR